ncbi:retinol dehydrogenase 16-like [Brevipalpus obovatus]|uniref:retinol dehydrogenase 16-like n=1 Tax=Brevipalpus obovatus TaxID=246614 RepID=UPI003D9EE618
MRLDGFLYFFSFVCLISVLVALFFYESILIIGLIVTPYAIFRLAWILTTAIRSLILFKVNPRGKAIFITGCDTGFGNETALKLNKRGFRVIASCLFMDGPGAEKLRTEAVHKDRMHIVKLDVTNDVDINNAYNEVESILKLTEDQLYGLLNNAGIIYYGNIEFGDFNSHFHRVLDINALGPVRVTRKFLPLIRQSKGRIVIISSIAGRLMGMNLTSYCMSKFAARAFADGLRQEVDQFGVKVIDIEPSYANTSLIDSNLIKKSFQRTVANTPGEIVNAYGKNYLKKSDTLFNFLENFDLFWNKKFIHRRVVQTVQTAFLSTDPFSHYLVLCAGIRMLIFTLWALPEEIALPFIRGIENVIMSVYAVCSRSSKKSKLPADYVIPV